MARAGAITVGKLTLLAKALTDKESDAVEMSMEIVPHGLKQTLGNTTTLMQNEADQTFNLDLPGRADAQARTLRIEASPSIAGALFGALDYLTSYPVRLHRTNDVELPAERRRRAGAERTSRRRRFAPRTIWTRKFSADWIASTPISTATAAGVGGKTTRLIRS